MASQTSISIRDGDIPRQSCSLTDSLGDVRIICEVTKETREIPVIDLDDSDDETPTKESDKQPESTSECSQPVPSSGAERIQNDPVEATSHSSLQPQVNSVNSDVSDLIINTDKGPHHRTEKINLTNASERIALTEKYNDEGQLFQTSNNRGQKRGNSHCSPASKVVVLFSPGLTHYNENIRLVRVYPQQHRENSNLASDVIHNNSKNLLLPHNSSVSLGTLSQNAEDGINSSVGSCASTTNGSTPANRLPLYARKTSGNGSPVSAERRDVNENLPLTGDNMKDKCPPKSDHTVSNSAMPLCLSHCETQLTRCSNTNSESSRLSLDVECLQLNRDKPISTVSESRKTTVDVLTSNHDTLPKTANTKSPISKTNGADSTVFGRVIVYDAVGVPNPISASQKDLVVPIVKKTTSGPLSNFTPFKATGENESVGTVENPIVLPDSPVGSPKNASPHAQTSDHLSRTNTTLKPLMTTNLQQPPLPPLKKQDVPPQLSVAKEVNTHLKYFVPSPQFINLGQIANQVTFLDSCQQPVPNFQIHSMLRPIVCAPHPQIVSRVPVVFGMPDYRFTENHLPIKNTLVNERRLFSTCSRNLRPIAIDGSNVAFSHGKNSIFSCKGIKICIDYFIKRGHTTVKAFVPQFRRKSSPLVHDGELLEFLGNKRQLVVFTPSREINGNAIHCYDDRFILEYASQTGAVVVSNDNFRDIMKENETWKETVLSRLLMYTFADDVFMVPEDPLGRFGPSLERFLSF